MTNKVSLSNLATFDPSIVTVINSNNSALTTAVQNTVSRDGTFPNQMNAPIDMNSNRILNLPAPINAVEPLRLQELINFTAGTGIVGPPGPAGANTSYPTKASVQAATILPAILSIHVDGYTSAGDGGGALYKRVSVQPTHQGKIQSADGAWWELSENIVNPMMFGADPTAATDSSAAFQNCYDYNVNGVNMQLNPAHAYRLDSAVVLKHPGSIVCGDGLAVTNSRFVINMGNSTADTFQVLSSSVTLRGLSISRPGTPSGSAVAIRIGFDTRVVTDMSGVNGSSTITSASAAFTSADIGKYITCGGIGLSGPSYPITSIISGTQASISPATATVTLGSQTGQIGFVYTDIVVQDCYIINHIIGIFVGSSQRCSIRNNRVYAKTAILQNNILWGDLGDHEYIGGTYQSTDQAAGFAFQLISGGGSKLTGMKLLQGSIALQIFWNGPSTSLGPFISNCSIESAASNGIQIICNSSSLDGVIVTGCEIGCGGTQVSIPNSSPFPLNNSVFTGNMTRVGGGNTHWDLGNCKKFSMSGNTCNGFGTGTGYILGTNSANAVISLGANDVTTVITNAGTGNTIK